MSRIRANQITNQSADGAPTVQNGLVISGVTTSTTLSISDTLSHSGDDDTKIRFPSADTVSIETGGNEQIRINHSSHIQLYNHIVPNNDSTKDIGLTGTRFRAAYVDTYYGDGSNLTGIDATQIVTGNTSVQTVDTGSDGHVKFTTEGTERARIDSSGRMGLGGTPTHKLELFNGSDVENILMIRGADATTEYAAMGVSGGNAVITGGGVGSTNAGISFRTAASGSEAERLRINASGDFGFNDTSPTAHASGNNTVLSIKGKGSSYSGKIDFKDSSGNIDSYINSDNSILQLYADPNSQNGNTAMQLFVHGGERLRINSNGSYYFLGDSSNNTRLRLLSDGAITGGSGNNDVSLEFASGQSNNMASEGAQLRYDNSNGKLHISTTYNSSDSDIRFYTRTGALDSESNLRMNIMGDGYVMTPSQPSFRATKSGSAFNTGGGTVVFNQNQHNVGSNYNTSNGRFTAPVTGVYIFHYYSIYQYNSSNDVWDFKKNGSNFPGSRMHFTNDGVGSSWDNITNTQILTLNANDYVEIYCSDHNLHGGDWAHFCGHLLG